MAIFVFGDHGAVIRKFCKDSKGTKIDITGATITLRWSQGGATEERPMTIENGPNGVATYVVQAGDFQPDQPVHFETEYAPPGERHTTPITDGPHTIRQNLEDAPMLMSGKKKPAPAVLRTAPPDPA
jgi:hypothetical protein